MGDYTFYKGRWRGHSTNDTKPDPVGKYLQRLQETDTGIIYYSDGFNWINSANINKTNINIITTDTTLDSSHNIVTANSSSGTLTISLPTAVGMSGKTYKIRKIGTDYNNIIIDADSSETIDGLSTWELKMPHDYVEIISDGSNWRILEHTGFNTYAFKRIGTTENRWYIACQTSNSNLSSLAVTVNILYASPIIISKISTINDIGVNVVTGAATTNAKFAIYNDNGNLQPSALLYESGEFSTATSGTFISATPALKLQPGIYWVCAIFSGTPSVRFIPVASQYPLLGIDNTPATTSSAPSYYKFVLYPGAGALPNPFPTSPVINSSSQIPAIYVRFSE